MLTNRIFTKYTTKCVTPVTQVMTSTYPLECTIRCLATNGCRGVNYRSKRKDNCELTTGSEVVVDRIWRKLCTGRQPIVNMVVARKATNWSIFCKKGVKQGM